MRLPTQNHSRSDDHSDLDDQDDGALSYGSDRQGLIPDDAKKVPLEPWQSAFVLGPNVRFTRTPESVIARRREAEAAAELAAAEKAAAEAQARANAPQPTVSYTTSTMTSQNANVFVSTAPTNSFGLPKTGSPLIVPRRSPPPRPVDAKPVVAEPSVVAEVQLPDVQSLEVQVEPVVMIAPQLASVAPAMLDTAKMDAVASPDLEATRLRQAAAAMRMAEDIAVHLHADDTQPEKPAAPKVLPALTIHAQKDETVTFASGKLEVSDFAFFEMMSFDAAEIAPAALPEPVAYVPVSRPITMPLYGSVAAFYREIKVRSAVKANEYRLWQWSEFPVSANIYPPVTIPVLAKSAVPAPQPVAPVMTAVAPEKILPQPVVEVVKPQAVQVVEGLVAQPAVPTPIEPAFVEPVPFEPVAVETAPAEVLPAVSSRSFSESPRANRAIGGLEMNRNHPFDGEYIFPSISLLQEPPAVRAEAMLPEALEQSAGLLESVLEDFGIRGEVIDVRPGPVVTLYEFEPAPGIKSSRVIGLADDIARSMSALSARVAVVPGRNVIGIELPNAVRETVYLRELIECEDYWETRFKLALCLGKSIGGEPVIAELAKMPHLLVAGTTGSGKSVAINTMILSLLYRLKPEECRLIMVDPKMLELSIYDGIPHLLTPVVTDPKKAVMALKWAVREMEDRYRKMSRLGVRNIDGYNARAAQAREKGEVITVSVQAGFDRQSGEILYEDQDLDLSHMPYIVIIVDEMADLMMVAGKEIEGAIQRLAQMARAAGIHLIMATQRPSVDVITGTIKANFPTRISFQVTSKIDSRTILGEQGAEHLLGQGDMLQMVGGGRICRVHGPFVSDAEVEQVVAHLKTQGRPEYLGTVTEEDGSDPAPAAVAAAVSDETYERSSATGGDESDELYEKAVKVVLRDQKCSTSYIQRRLSVGYNRAASLVERMEREGLVGAANHVGKREIIAGSAIEPANSGIGFNDGE
ncbi:DNA translocase FtsK [Rhizobium oryziradicis]|uniref:Cell division protein FtsK n=1 Tax=Rhizobium oryziradicis TaxID=1867956 RepID=A0A1Q8ZKP6_9HYPH|nr:DNA translocase FtsK [Rhizobium oryziradicis]OLP42310.1 cell division protein FtsK [Rhizobium oryziradicis]